MTLHLKAFISTVLLASILGGYNGKCLGCGTILYVIEWTISFCLFHVLPISRSCDYIKSFVQNFDFWKQIFPCNGGSLIYMYQTLVCPVYHCIQVYQYTSLWLSLVNSFGLEWVSRQLKTDRILSNQKFANLITQKLV